MRIRLPADPLLDGPTALRAWRDSDLPAIVAACQDPEIPRWTRVPQPYGETDARAYLLHRHDAIHTGQMAPFAIVDATDPAGSAEGALLGSISLMRFNHRHRRSEVGYWLAAPARGQGHAARAVELICAWGFEHLELERIELLADPRNAPSLHVAQRTGFTREALLRSFTAGTHSRQDMVMHSLLRSEATAPASRAS